MSNQFKRLTSLFLSRGCAIGADLTCLVQAIVGVGLVFGVILLGNGHIVHCANSEDTRTPLARLVDTLTPEQVEQFNARGMAMINGQKSLIGSIVLAITINVIILGVVYYGPTIWNTAVNIGQHLVEAFGQLALGFRPPTGRALAQVLVERANRDPELTEQLLRIGYAIIEEYNNTGGGCGPAA